MDCGQIIITNTQTLFLDERCPSRTQNELYSPLFLKKRQSLQLSPVEDQLSAGAMYIPVSFTIFHEDQQQFLAMSRVKTNRSLTEIDLLLERTLVLLEENLRKEDYVEAENCKLAVQQMKKDREAARIRDLERKHEEEKQDLALLRETETKALYQDWEDRLKLQAGEAELAHREMQTRHAMEEERTRQELEAGSPLKVKESPQCLNLRKQEAFMVKQKNYAQAHLVQQQIAEMQRVEREKWMATRKTRIETAIKHLHEKQENQQTNLQKNVKATLNESRRLRGREEQKLQLKFSNLERDLAMKQEKEKLAHKGEFTSKGGEGSPLLTKSRLLKSRE